ncbi:hypothetical protein [Salisediminibacterium beveridgei]|uniref:Uncharacterized protein n=1 Tax=Salisediminibacterium beveridgei TaxID=632773 RepID=A0A1D7QYS3_9BACI|nr:hypothetical protein [Salisediminibacterium beveridgei]AOM84150.1 hypothetical protein BBEV_2825 [Salisediminibacterium beveridgei]
MKRSLKMYSAVAALPLLVMACGPEEETNQMNEEENHDAENVNANDNGEGSADEVDDLAEEYGISVTVNEEASGDAETASLDELEEVFNLIAAAQETELLQFQDSPDEGEAEQSGEATGAYAIPGAETKTLEIDFAYELDGDLEDETRLPTFADVSDTHAEIAEAGILSWEQSSVDTEMAGAGTIAEFSSEGEWLLMAEYDGVEVEAAEPDQWLAEFSSSVLAGIE